MKLSVIIVNYNVCYFLDQALDSLLQSKTDFEFEIIVVDNGSRDGSIQMLNKKYPGVQLIETGANLGFAKANNIAAKRCIGEYLLLLNPDTLLKADTLQKCIDFLEGKKEAGALGVKMHDGSGKYLPESKRGFPGPWTAFFKITGLNTLFPNSKWFNYYYLGHLPIDENQSVDVLTGAFMMLKRDKYMELNGLDEDFFMYGEDIDLCYRLNEKGYTNYYLASSSIIHFKGESTSKRSVGYVKTFYKAMSIYARKHYGRRFYAFLSFFIQMAIYARALVAILSQRLRFLFPFLRDTFLIGGIGWSLSLALDQQITGIPLFMSGALVPLIWSLLGVYQRDFNWWLYTLGGISAIIPFALLIIVLGWELPLIVWISALLLIFFKIGFMLAKGESVFTPMRKAKQVAGIISDQKGERAIRQLMDLLREAPMDCKLYDPTILEKWNSGDESVPDEIIFDPKVVAWDTIVHTVLNLSPDKDFRILSLNKQALITSRSKNETASIITSHKAERENMRKKLYLKPVSDKVFSVLVLMCSPILLFLKGKDYLQNALEVILGKKTWVGASEISSEWGLDLPTAVYDYREELIHQNQLRLAQLIYIRTYHPLKDWSYLLRK